MHKESFLHSTHKKNILKKTPLKKKHKLNLLNKKKTHKNKIKKYLMHINKHKIKKNLVYSEKKHIQHSEVILGHPMKKGTFWNSSPFGVRYNTLKKKYEMHGGVDFAASEGTPVYAAESGFVIKISIQNHGFGKCIVLQHETANAKTRYAHLSKILVKYEQAVKKGEIIGLVGATGNTRGRINASHLHFELIIDNKKYNPMLHIRKSIQ